MSYGAPPPSNPYGGAAVQDHPKGTTILILGILSLVCCGLFTGIPAIIMGRNAQAEGQFANSGTIKAGYICGIIGTALSVLGIILNIILLAAGASLYN